MDELMLENDLPPIPDAAPTLDVLLAEAKAQGKKFNPVSARPELLVLDAEEMLEARADLPAFLAAGFPVTEGMFVRLELLMRSIAQKTAQRERDAELRKAYTAKAEARRNALLKFHQRIKRRARAARLPASLFSLGRINPNRLGSVLWRVEEIALTTKDQIVRFAQQPVVGALVDGTLGLIDTIKSERRQLGMMGAEGVADTLLQQQLERLLFDTMRYLGAQGLALFDEDPTKDKRYRLDHVYGNRTPAADEDLEPELPPAPADGDEA